MKGANAPVVDLELDRITAGDNDRIDFDPVALQELADSILKNGLAQPITVRPRDAVAAYERDGRAAFFSPGTRRSQRPSAMFMGTKGERIGTRAIVSIVHTRAKAAELTMRVYPHLLRHTAATHLLEGGMPMAVLQAFLGHTMLEDTERYIHVSADFIRESYYRHFPGESDALP